MTVSAALSSYSHITSDLYRLWLAQSSLRSTEFKIGTFQHAGFGLIDLLTHCPLALWEHDIADYYFIWGLGSSVVSDKTYVGGIKKRNIFSYRFSRQQNISNILIVIEQPPLSPIDNKSFEFWKKMLQDVAWLVEKLDNLGCRASVRLYLDKTKDIQKIYFLNATQTSNLLK